MSVVWPKYNDKHCNWLIQGVLVFCIEAGKLTCPLMRSNVAHKNKVRKILYNVVFQKLGVGVQLPFLNIAWLFLRFCG